VRRGQRSGERRRRKEKDNAEFAEDAESAEKINPRAQPGMAVPQMQEKPKRTG
jgi:hypothetical protein